jgi:hypothetical protein
MTVFVLPQVDRWELPDPLPHDLTHVWAGGTVGYTVDAHGELYADTDEAEQREYVSWWRLLDNVGYVTRYREAS